MSPVADLSPHRMSGPRSAARRPLLDVRRIYVQPAAAELPRGREILARWPDAERVEVLSRTAIPELHGDEANVRRWVRMTSEALVLGVTPSLTARPNGRYADFIAPSTANGGAMACAYCYAPRHGGYSNPITVFANIEEIVGYLERHVRRQGPKPPASQCDPDAWVYDIGENSDCSVDALLSRNVADLVELFARLPTAKASFATTYVNRELLDLDPRGHTRIRFSLMAAADAKLFDVRTSPVAKRIAAIDDFVAAGYEVHLNLSPVVVHDGWLEAWGDLLTQVADGVGPAARAQLAAQVIFLTHDARVHDVNLGRHPMAEDLLWRPDLQEIKRSRTGDVNVRYRAGGKAEHVADLADLVARILPACRLRYAF